MDVLIAIGTSASYFYSVLAILLNILNPVHHCKYIYIHCKYIYIYTLYGFHRLIDNNK